MPISINSSPSNVNLFNKTQEKREKTDESLASGKRINRAADDAAGLVIANRLTGEINSLNEQTRGAQDQINLNNVQSARFSAITDGLARAQTLSVQSGNPLYQGDPAIQDELNAITEQVNLVAEEALGVSNFVSGFDASDPATTQANIETALQSVATQASSVGANSNALSAQVNAFQSQQVNLSESRSRIQDTDVAAATSERSQNSTLEEIALKLQRNQQERKGLLINKLI